MDPWSEHIIKSIPFHISLNWGLSIPHGHNLMSCIRKSFGKCRPSAVVISTYRMLVKMQMACCLLVVGPVHWSSNTTPLLPDKVRYFLAAAASGPVNVRWSDLKLKTEFMLLFSVLYSNSKNKWEVHEEPATTF